MSNIIADLSLAFADAKGALSDSLIENLHLKEKIKELETKLSEKSKLIYKDGHYTTQSGEGCFCSGCYDSKGIQVRLQETTGPFRDFGKYTCPVCKQHFK